MAREAEQSHWRHGDRARHGEYLAPRGDAEKIARDRKQAEGRWKAVLVQRAVNGDEYFARS